MITSQRIKIRTNGDKYRNFITYFQSVTTLGIVNRARTPQEAEKQAKFKMRDQSFMCGVLGHTPYELHATEEWQSNIEDTIMKKESNPPPPSISKSLLDTLLDGNTKECIADKFGKDPKNLTDEDYVRLIKNLIEMGLE